MTTRKLIPRLAVATIACGALVYSLAGFAASGNGVNQEGGKITSSVPSLVKDNHSRSLFDQLFSTRDARGTSYDIPFPFSSLISKIEQHLGNSINDNPNKVKLALFPLSRCVNRYAADPDFFKSPRVVLAVDSEEMNTGSGETLFLKDQLFIGYQQHARALEVISYNNTDGRFEFQVVSDYAESGQPKVRAARRQDCVSCHQNQGPIFPRAYWNETDYNPNILEAILEAQDLPDQKASRVSRHQTAAVNGAVNRANMFSLHQTLWQEGCQSDDILDGILCRAALFETVMLDQLAESYRRQVPSEQVSRYLIETSKKNIARLWPKGIELPSSSLPSISPLSKGALEYLRSATQLEQPRAEVIHWQPNDLYRVVKGLGGLIAKSNILRVDQTLGRISDARQTGRENRAGTCGIRVARSPTGYPYGNRFNGDVTAECRWHDDGLSGEFNLLGDLHVTRGRVRSNSGFNSVFLGGRNFLVKFRHRGGEIVSSNGRSSIQLTLSDSNGKLRARLPGGRTIESIDISWQGHLIDTDFSGEADNLTGKATLKIRSNPRILEEAIAQLANASHSGDANVFADKPFNAQTIMAALFSTLEAMESDSLSEPSELSSVLPVDQSEVTFMDLPF